jgi:hypothetical protein
LDRRRLYNYESWHRKGSRADLPMLYPEVLDGGSEVGDMVRKLTRCISMLSFWCDDQFTCFRAICTRSTTVHTEPTPRGSPGHLPTRPHNSAAQSPGSARLFRSQSTTSQAPPSSLPTTRSGRHENRHATIMSCPRRPQLPERAHRCTQGRECDEQARHHGGKTVCRTDVLDECCSR